MVYVNQVGGQDELVFDGGSFALQADGELCMRLPMFEEALGLIALGAVGRRSGAARTRRWRPGQRGRKKSIAPWCWACATM